MEFVFDAMLKVSGLDRDVLLDRRIYPAPDCRAMMYKWLADTGMSTVRIGRMFGYDHATVTCALKRLPDHLTFNAELRDIYSRFTAMI